FEGRAPDFSGLELPRFEPGGKVATRKASEAALNAIARALPSLLGGSADLAGSNFTDIAGERAMARGDMGGRIVRFGVREHAMGAIVNGLALHGGIVKPFGSTFLIFSDYMRPALRLSALMRLPVVWVFTHDSVGLGEDGPTHQPVEQCLSLRAIPGLWVIRPADANETSAAWKIALERQDGPTAILLTRQAVPVLEPIAGTARAGVERGAYVAWDSRDAASRDTPLDLVLIATGSEVWICLEAARTLAADDVAVRVVSMPCWELFEAQPAAYRDEVLPPDVDKRLAVEAGVSLGWERWVGDRGAALSIDRFGASAPGTTVLEKLGFTPENVATRARTLLE
ncbi:MAG: transketolase, partial [Gammaproteobacteria bacterium]